jgi:hypothetical protein
MWVNGLVELLHPSIKGTQSALMQLSAGERARKRVARVGAVCHIPRGEGSRGRLLGDTAFERGLGFRVTPRCGRQYSTALYSLQQAGERVSGLPPMGRVPPSTCPQTG